MNRLRGPHTIALDEILTANPVRTVLASCRVKRLVAEWDIADDTRKFVVYLAASGTVMYDGPDLAAAIEAYNEVGE